MSQIQTILDGLTNLSPDDLAKVRQVANHLAGDVPDESVSDAVSQVWPIFIEQVSERGVKMPPVSILSRHHQYKKLAAGCDHLLAFTKKFKPKNGVERVGAIRLCVQALLIWIDTMGVPVTVKTLAQQLDHVGAAVDAQFPNYLAAGLLPILLRADKRTAR